MTKNVWLSFDAFLNRLEQCFKERGQHKYLVSLNSSRNDSTCIDQSDYVRREIIDELAKQRVAADGLDISYEPYLLILDLGRSNYQSIAELIMTCIKPNPRFDSGIILYSKKMSEFNIAPRVCKERMSHTKEIVFHPLNEVFVSEVDLLSISIGTEEEKRILFENGKHYLEKGDFEAAGFCLFESLPGSKSRVSWTTRLLQYMCEIEKCSDPLINRCIKLLGDPSQWRYCHDMFDEFRGTERAYFGSISNAIRTLTELALKVGYDQSGQWGPFDRDNGWAVVSFCNEFIELHESKHQSVKDEIYKRLLMRN